MDFDLDDESIKEFILEASELLEDAEQGLLNIEDGDDYQKNFNSVFRAFHSIKGGAGMLGMQETNKVVHFLEDVLTEADKTKTIDARLVDFFLKGIDCTKKALNGQEHGFDFKSPFDVDNTKPIKDVAIKQRPKSTNEDSQVAKIYHVDDEQDVLDAVKEILEAQGHQVTSFLSGEEMLQVIRPGEVDIVLSDFKMPTMSGTEVLKEVKSIDPDVPCILLSGYLDQQTCIDAINNGTYALLEKPMDIATVYATLSNAHNTVKYSRLIGRSIKLLMYQFSDLSEFLKAAGKENIIQTVKQEMEHLIIERNALREAQKKQKTS